MIFLNAFALARDVDLVEAPPTYAAPRSNSPTSPLCAGMRIAWVTCRLSGVNSMLDDVARKDRFGSGAVGSGSNGEYIFTSLTS